MDGLALALLGICLGHPRVGDFDGPKCRALKDVAEAQGYKTVEAYLAERSK